MAKKLGELIKEARTGAGFTQTQLAEKVSSVTAADLSKAERGEKELSQAVLKAIAKATGVTQASLLNAAAGKTSSAGKTAGKTSGKTTGKSAGKTSSTGKKTGKTASAKPVGKTTASLSAAEKKLVELYRAADSDTKKAAVKLLKGEKSDTSEMLTSLLTNAMTMLGKNTRQIPDGNDRPEGPAE
jgi:transcriptional regulator with XRE-family HTH domain